MSCPQCSTVSKAGDAFCSKCGAKLLIAEEGTIVTVKLAEPVSITVEADSDSIHGRFIPGTILGDRYRIVELLGRGGMGEIYRADDLKLGQSVALKFVSERVVLDPLLLARFRKEVRIARQVTHPNVCRMHDMCEAD